MKTSIKWLFLLVLAFQSCASLKYSKMLDSDDSATRRQGAADIQSLGPKGAPALKLLCKAAEDKDPELRRLAIEAIGGLGKTAYEASWLIIRSMRDSDVHVRRASIIALGNLHQFPTAAFPQLIVCLGDPDSLVREFAINTFEGLGTAGVGTLARALKNTNVTIRRSAVVALGRLGPEASFAMEALKRAGADSDLQVSRLADDTVKRLIQEKTRKF